MYLLIHHAETEFPVRLPTDLFIIHNIQSHSANPTDYLYRTNQEEFLLNQVTESLDQSAHQNIKAVIICRDLGGNGWVRAVNLAGHFACTQFDNCKLNKVPIILADWDNLDINDLTLKHTTLDNFLQTEGIYFKKYEELFAIRPDPLTNDKKYAIESLIGKLKPVSVKQLNIRIPSDSNHQSANEWGVMRLASNFGLLDSLHIDYPKHLYFKYLLNFISQDEKPIDRSLNGLFTNVLLIDDNAALGWDNLIGMILNCKVTTLSTPEEIDTISKQIPETFSKHQLIFLDLYLNKQSKETTTALDLLRHFKTRFPQIPLIILTASDKAWNLDSILERGADGMCIKESPLYYRDDGYSDHNFDDFKKMVTYVYSKYQVLRPYWDGITEIFSSPTFEKLENQPRKIRDRIVERLTMFFGLLKKGFEQWDYDKETFYYSDYELAFMTLWSVLNEIQESYYDKEDKTPITNLKDGLGNPVLTEKDGSAIIPRRGFNWRIKGQSEFYVNHEFGFEAFDPNGSPTANLSKYRLKSVKSKCNIVFNSGKAPYYSHGTTVDRRTAHLELSNQIAFLLLNHNLLKSSPKRDEYLVLLNHLNSVRNSLYLTHGESRSTYFAITEQAKREQPSYSITPEKDISNLLRLVSFLLTGKELKIDFRQV